MCGGADETRVKPENELLMGRILMIVGAVGVAITLLLEALGVFHDWGILLTIVFGGVGLFGVITAASRKSVEELKDAFVGSLKEVLVEQRKTNATLERIEQSLRRPDRPPGESS